MASFATWFEQTTGEAFEPQAVDPREITDYRGFLLQRDSKPATVNRRLIALRRFFLWAKRRGHANSSPFEILENVQVKKQKEVAPRWLSRKDQLALLRAVRRSDKARDLALIQMMLGTGFPAVYRAGTGFFAPPTARRVALSTAQRPKSIWSAFRSWASRISWIFCQ